MKHQHKFGVLSYLNCLPVTWAMESGLLGADEWRIQRGTPAELNDAISAGDLEISVVSTAEYIENGELYTPIGGYALWCDGPVESVCLYSGETRSQLRTGSGVVAVTPESATSVALTQVLLPNCETECFTCQEDALAGLEDKRYRAVLLIGDRALRPPDSTRSLLTHDLGEWWKERTGLPMTYALWVARKSLEQKALESGTQLLERSLQWGEVNLESVVQEAQRRSGLSPQRLLEYYERLCFRATSASQAGLEEFRTQVETLQRWYSPKRIGPLMAQEVAM